MDATIIPKLNFDFGLKEEMEIVYEKLFYFGIKIEDGIIGNV